MNDMRTERRDWRDWSCDVSVVVGETADADAAADIVRTIMTDIELACSRFRPDSELTARAADLDAGATVSDTLTMLVAAALEAAQLTDGDLDPTLGFDLAALGYSGDLSTLTPVELGDEASTTVHVTRRGAPGWTRVRLDGRRLTVPRDLQLDLGASGKAVAVDRAVAEVATRLGTSALVNIGGDLATAGPPMPGGWQIAVQDLPDDPWQQVALESGAAMTTSSTQKRRWSKDGQVFHHLLDPRTGFPANPVWRSVTVAADTCLRANAFSSAAVIRGFRAVDWLDGLGVGARFVDRQGRVVTTGSWPAPVAELDLSGGRS